MASPFTKHKNKIVKTIQEMFNLSFDTDFNQNAMELIGYDGTNLQRLNAENMATKITEVGDVTYVGVAAPGTLESAAKWKCQKIDETTGTVITWANGDGDYDNIATDLTALTYS